MTYAPPPFHFGTLRTINDEFTDKADDEYAAGTRVGMYDVFWDRAQPASSGSFSAAYAMQVTNETAAIRSAGLKLTLGLGLGAPPSWVAGSVSNPYYVNEAGTSSAALNLTFNQLIRDAAEDYLDWVHAQVGFGNVWSVRIAAMNGGELLYPNGGLWGYDLNAKGTSGNLPPTIPPSPYPTWTPGTGTVAQAEEWIEWYLSALADTAAFQMRILVEKYGYDGWFEILTPGDGTRPSAQATEITNRFSGYSATTGVGAWWNRIYQLLPDMNGVVVYVSSMADNSGVPANDVPTGADTATAVTATATNNWSAYRWQVRVANEFGCPNGGENPGYGALANSYYNDTTSTGMMAKSLAQAQGGKALSFYWAHSTNLYGTSGATITLANYSSKIAAINTGGPGVPPDPPEPAAAPSAGGELPFVGTLGLSYDRDELVNVVRAARDADGATVFEVGDPVSRNRYRDRAHEQTDLPLATDAEVQGWAQYVLARDAYPKLRFTDLTVDVRVNPDLLYPQVLRREFGDRIAVVRRPPGGITDTREMHIRGIRHEFVAPDQWLTTWALEPATSVDPFFLDDTIMGRLDAGRELIY